MDVRGAAGYPDVMGSQVELDIVVAMTRDGLIGRAGGLPWHIPEEQRLFRSITMGGTLIMGRRTWESIGRSLPGRVSIVVSRTLARESGPTSSGRSESTGSRASAPVLFIPGFDAALRSARELGRPVHVIGGTEIFRAALPLADRLHISWIDLPAAHPASSGDTRFPEFALSAWTVEREERFADFTYTVYGRGTAER